MRVINPPVLFELHAEIGGMPWTCATSSMRRTHSLAPRPGSLVRLTFQIGPCGRTCTCNLSVLSGTPLHWATRGWCPRSELHRHSTHFKCAASALGYVGEMVGVRGIAPPRPTVSETALSAVRGKPHAV